MPDFTLTPTSPLKGFDKQFGDIRLREVTDQAILSLATPLGGETALKAAVGSAWGLEMPAPGRSSRADDGKVHLLGLGADQIFILKPHDHLQPDAPVREALNGAGYATDQSDVWAMLEITGPGLRRALERICPLDLHPDAFPVGAVARTMMEHMGAIILRSGEDAFILLAASSSAGSFLHAVETSLNWTAP